MKFNVKSEILDYDGKPVKENEKDNATWKKIIFNALNNILPDEKLTAEQKEKCYDLTARAYAREEVEYSVEEVAFILERVKRIYTPLIVGRAIQFFEGEKKKVSN
jgi:hypothetical protein